MALLCLLPISQSLGASRAHGHTVVFRARWDLRGRGTRRHAAPQTPLLEQPLWSHGRHQLSSNHAEAAGNWSPRPRLKPARVRAPGEAVAVRPDCHTHRGGPACQTSASSGQACGRRAAASGVPRDLPDPGPDVTQRPPHQHPSPGFRRTPREPCTCAFTPCTDCQHGALRRLSRAALGLAQACDAQGKSVTSAPVLGHFPAM